MLNIIPIPAFKDNYIWTLHRQQYAVVVDPGDAAPIRACLDAQQIKLAAILCTHHHNDHVGGISELAQLYNVPVYGPRHEDIPCLSHAVGEGDMIKIAELNITLQVFDIPGHTRGHVAYLTYGSSKEGEALFCGDTLFSCGCGRLFEGTAVQLHQSLQRLAALPEATKVYCAHEYTETNIRFALVCEAGNDQLKQRQLNASALRRAGQATLPSTIALEKATNPFLRCAETQIIRSVEQHTGNKFDITNDVDVFSALRKWRNNF